MLDPVVVAGEAAAQRLLSALAAQAALVEGSAQAVAAVVAALVRQVRQA